VKFTRAGFCALLFTLVCSVAGAQDLEQIQESFNQLFQASRYKEAAPVAEEIVRLTSQAHGSDSMETGDAFLGLGMTYHLMKDFSRAASPLEKASQIFLDKAEPGELRTAMATYYLGLSLYKLKRFVEAKPWLQRSLPGRAETLGSKGLEEHLMALSVCCWSTEDHLAAVPVLERLVLLKKEKERDDAADWMSYLGESLRKTGAYRRAVFVYQESLHYPHRNRLLTARLYAGLGEALIHTGDFAQAEKFLKDALHLTETELGKSDPKTLEVVGYLAQLYTLIGDSRTASRYWRRFLKNGNPAVGSQAAKLLVALGERDSEELLAAFDELLEIMRGSEPDEPALAVLEAYRGVLLQNVGRYDEAEPILNQKLGEVARILGPTHPLVGLLYQRIALLYFTKDEPAQAEQFLRQGLEIQARAFGEDSPVTGWTRFWLAVALRLQEKSQEARAQALKYRDVSEKTLANILSFASERQRLNYLTVSYPYLLASLGFGEDSAQTVLRNKGVILDSMVEDARLAEAVGDSRLSDLREAKRQVVQRALAGKDTGALERRVESLEGQLARSFAELGKSRRALSVTVPQVQAALPDGAVLVEFLRFGGAERNVWPPRYYYGAVVIPKSGPPRFVNLGLSEPIERGIRRLRGAISRREPVTALLKALDEVVWQPVASELPSTTRQVVISPDSALNLLPFATLLGPQDRFLAERFELRMVSTGRDLLTEPGRSSKTMTVVADPDFEAPVKVETQGAKPVESLSFPPLPGTRAEADALQAVAAGTDWSCKILRGNDANESNLKGESPGILHIASHGFFLGAEQDNELAQDLYTANIFDFDRAVGDLENPMYRSGLALSGAESTARAWSRGERPPAHQDGILTAQEAGRMNLENTLLVTLSACDTGLGQSRSGEGVLGLRRALSQAGAQNILLTLWQVDDQFTATFMREFYESTLASGRPAGSLNSVQRAALVELRESKGVDMAVYLAGAFQLTSQGRL